MKRVLIAVSLATLVAGMASASTAFSCSGVATASNSCYSSNLPIFNTQLDWAVFGTPDGTLHSGVWTASSNGISVDVSTQNVAATEGLKTAYNYARILDNGFWALPTEIAGISPYNFNGHFDAPPDVNSAFGPSSPGDHLMGLSLDGTSQNSLMTLNFSQTFNDIGFRIAAVSNPTFDAIISIYSGANGTGTLLNQLNLSSLGGGGTCASLRNSTPVPCNDAPFVAFMAQNAFASMTIWTNDNTGFFISNLSIAEAPEPTSLILCGCGVALLAFGKKRISRS